MLPRLYMLLYPIFVYIPYSCISYIRGYRIFYNRIFYNAGFYNAGGYVMDPNFRVIARVHCIVIINFFIHSPLLLCKNCQYIYKKKYHSIRILVLDVYMKIPDGYFPGKVFKVFVILQIKSPQQPQVILLLSQQHLAQRKSKYISF